MKTAELNKWFGSLLDPARFEAADPSRNGLQVDNDGADITRVAFAVDACAQTIEKAASLGAGMLFVHHGLFWKDPLMVTGSHYKRIKLLMQANMALYASHLPLDAHVECGNNAGLAARLQLENIQPFARYRGMEIGYFGALSAPASLDALCAALFPDGHKPRDLLPFGPKHISSVGIVSGGAADEVHQAIGLGLDLFITGEITHEIYHPALENGISVIACGHYYSETVGPRLVSARLAKETGMDTVFIDAPTGL